MKKRLRILALCNSFKGSLNSGQVNKAVLSEIRKIFPGAECRSFPVSDGGDGFLECFLSEPGVESRELFVRGPAVKKVKARYLIKGREAYIEIAEACGIKHLKKYRLAPLTASSRGVGELILDAEKRGAEKIYLGLGGTASSDGGAGMARALGFRFLNGDGRETEETVPGLLSLEKIIRPKRTGKISFYALTDVRNPLLGKRGSARVYGPQKGASPKQVLLIEKALSKLSKTVKFSLDKNISSVKGGGAAGGLGAGLFGFLGADILNGAEFIAGKLNLEKEIKASQIIITGEGRLDKSTFFGKMPGLICQLSAKNRKKTIFITGTNSLREGKIPANCMVLELDRHFPREYSMSSPEKAIKKTLTLNSEKIKKVPDLT